jgi:hypothetical protein
MKHHTRPVFRLASMLLLCAGFGCYACAASAAPSPDSIRQHRLDLLLKAGKQPPGELKEELNRLAIESERCRIQNGSKACGLSQEPLPGGNVDQVFDYYVKKPTESLIDRQRLGVAKSDWNWAADSKTEHSSADRP